MSKDYDDQASGSMLHPGEVLPADATRRPAWPVTLAA